MKLEINSFRYVPLRGRSYIPLPKELAVKKAIINMKNPDDQCFKWAVTRALNPVNRNAERIDKKSAKTSRKTTQMGWNRVPSKLERHW